MSKNNELVRLNTEDLGQKVKEFLEILHDRVKGQDMALRDIATAYERKIFGLKKRDKPIFCGLFLGPSGVGKTLVSEILAEHLFGSRDAFCKIKCGDLKQSHQMASLIGSPPGYVGFQDPSDPERYNEESAHPMLSQWNIDRYDAERLKKENEEERNKFLERKKKYDDYSEAVDKTTEEIKKIQEEIVSIEKEITELENQQKKTPPRKQWGIASRVNKLKARLQIVKNKEVGALKKLTETVKAHSEEKTFLQKWYKDMAEKGVIYDSDIPYPYTSIVLFDEIEKADESLYHLLFEIMDKGQLQLANGKTTSFRNTFLFMTGNVGEQEISDILSGNANLGFRQQTVADDKEANEKIYQVAVEAAKERFPPPFLGRLDKIVVFRPLKFETMVEILEVHIAELHRDFLEAGNPILLDLEPAVKKFLVEQAMEGGRNAYGARNLKARLDKFITHKLIRALGNDSLKPPAEVFAKLEEVNGVKKVALYSQPLEFPGDKKNHKTNP